MVKRKRVPNSKDNKSRFVKLPEISDPLLSEFVRKATINKPLSKEEQIDLLQKAKQGDSSAMEQLINSNLRFIIKVAVKCFAKYKQNKVTISDLVVEGIHGFIRGVEKFDFRKNVHPLSYIGYWVYAFINKSFDEAIQSYMQDTINENDEKNNMLVDISYDPFHQLEVAENASARINYSIHIFQMFSFYTPPKKKLSLVLSEYRHDISLLDKSCISYAENVLIANLEIRFSCLVVFQTLFLSVKE